MKRENISIAFPLDTGDFARLYLPPDLTKSEARRLCKAIRALVNPGWNEPSVADWKKTS